LVFLPYKGLLLCGKAGFLILKQNDDYNEKYLVVAQELFAIPWKEVAIIVKKKNKKAAYRNTVSRFSFAAKSTSNDENNKKIHNEEN
jgi:hypothetical protein